MPAGIELQLELILLRFFIKDFRYLDLPAARFVPCDDLCEHERFERLIHGCTERGELTSLLCEESAEPQPHLIKLDPCVAHGKPSPFRA